ncbi:MAG: hypothetical protein Q8S26_08880 [Azonexus sp.]|nr:hypothetical protein [Azonexus sp.]
MSFLLLLTPGVHAQDESGCASSIRELRMLVGDPHFPHRWEEASMDDGKPLKVSIFERNGALRLEFIKTGEGMWADIPGVICLVGTDLELRMSKEKIALGPAINWMFRLALAQGGVFTMQRRAPRQLQIGTQGWNGSFVPAQAN